ncbi:MAG: Gfo/Idh/MocA family oxidoreductase [Candidatus Binatia bacterium]
MGARLRVGLIGCGRIARVHRAYLQGIESVELIGVCDTDAAARSAFATECGLPAFGSVAELLERGRPDVAHVLTPPATHAPLALELLQGGVNVLVEKPMALATAEAEVVIAAAHRADRWVSVDHNRWFDPVVQEAAAIVEGGCIGSVVGVEVFQGAEVGEADKHGEAAVHWSARLPGGLLNNLASHPLYLARRFAGPLRNLRVSAQRDGSILEEVRLIAEGDRALVGVTMSLRAQPFMNRLAVLGTAATLEVNLNNMTLIERRTRRLPKLVGKVWPNIDEAIQLVRATVRNGIAYATGAQRFYPGIGLHLRALYAAAAAGEEPPVSAAEGRDVVAWYDEILAQSGITAPPVALAG